MVARDKVGFTPSPPALPSPCCDPLPPFPRGAGWELFALFCFLFSRQPRRGARPLPAEPHALSLPRLPGPPAVPPTPSLGRAPTAWPPARAHVEPQSSGPGAAAGTRGCRFVPPLCPAASPQRAVLCPTFGARGSHLRLKSCSSSGAAKAAGSPTPPGSSRYLAGRRAGSRRRRGGAGRAASPPCWADPRCLRRRHRGGTGAGRAARGGGPGHGRAGREPPPLPAPPARPVPARPPAPAVRSFPAPGIPGPGTPGAVRQHLPSRSRVASGTPRTTLPPHGGMGVMQSGIPL